MTTAHGNPSLAELVAMVSTARPGRGTTVVVGIDGPSGSGKTTLAATLADAIGGTPVVHMDDLYPGWDGLADAIPRLVEQALEPLARGEIARYQRYDWLTGRYAEWVPVPDAAVLIVEGVASTAGAAAPYIDVPLWIEAPQPIRYARGIERDGEAYAPHWTRWQRQENELYAVNRTRDRAVIVLDGTVPLSS